MMLYTLDFSSSVYDRNEEWLKSSLWGHLALPYAYLTLRYLTANKYN